MSESRLLEIIRERLLNGSRGRGSLRVRVDIGDDAAVLAWGGADVVSSVDSAVEGVHFRRAWASLDQIGARSFSAAVSDLAAMGSEPRAALVALALPRGTTEEEVGALVDGLARASEQLFCPIVGGNLTRASEISITTTVLGEGTLHLTRSGARPGDEVFVSGTVGDAALGLALLEAGRRRDAGAQPFVERFLAPLPQIALGRSLAGHATSAIDLSDGLVTDLGHLLDASRVSAELDIGALPLSLSHGRVARSLGLEPLDLALDGGEDYGLLFTLPSGRTAPSGTTRIGRVTQGNGTIDLVLPDGTRQPRARAGHDHFR